ncbi:ATP-dependent protease LonB [Bacillus piscicola]|uniref:ATP-dependent protease LonB n=1 Tax=Bacillus piscicola TaxID=1632684 RepID=UPI001F09334B|nr:ATP-dependent protease LonB [Bacillus piscicola]
MNFTMIALMVQVFFGIVIGMYFWNLLRNQRSQKVTVERDSKKEIAHLNRLRSISLSEPLSEKVRPSELKEVIGQSEGIKALQAALCGENPQHVLIYGPPGIGKTAAARLVLEMAKKNPLSPFKKEAAFVELDGTTARFDDRGIADPLIGSVHDPIYQGAGAMGQAGIPQPKHGAVTKAHGGMLFIDEIGELHSIQLNKLLKVLEDRKVYLDSAYYSEENKQIPTHIHDIFQNGLPADFRLVGATTRSPEELPAALRSRCLEIFFRSLDEIEVKEIAKNAAAKSRISIGEEAMNLVAKYANNGRDAVNIVQIAAGLAAEEKRKEIYKSDLEWVIRASRLTPRHQIQVNKERKVGIVSGLAVTGTGTGLVIELEVAAHRTKGVGSLTVTGIMEEENHGSPSYSAKRKSLAKSSLENVMTVLQSFYLPVKEYNIHVNFPGGIPVDGPSAGAACALAIYSSIKNIKIEEGVAVTGEIGIHGDIKPVGGVAAKVDAAVKAGAKHIYIPADNDQQSFHTYKTAKIYPIRRIEELLKGTLCVQEAGEKMESLIPDKDAAFSTSLLSDVENASH